MKITEKTKNALKFLSENFTQKDYEDYLTGNTSYNNLCKKFDCSDYLMSTFFKSMGYEKRRSRIKNTIKEDIFDNIDSSEKAYIFGFYMADGCITSQNYFKISISNNDIDILTKMKDYIAPSCKIHIKSEYINHKTGIKTNPMCEFVFKNNHIAETLNSYNCGHNKTYIDKSIKNIVPEEFMWDFIRGYFDGDGCLTRHVNKTVVTPVASILGTFDFLNSIEKYSDVIGNCRHDSRHSDNTFSIEFNKEATISFINYIYLDAKIYLDRKYKLYLFFKNGSRSVEEFTELLSGNIGGKPEMENTEINSEITQGSESSYSVEGE